MIRGFQNLERRNYGGLFEGGCYEGTYPQCNQIRGTVISILKNGGRTRKKNIPTVNFWINTYSHRDPAISKRMIKRFERKNKNGRIRETVKRT